MRSDDIESEQKYIDQAYSHLDELRQKAQAIEDGFVDVGRGGTHQAKYEKDAAISLARTRIANLNIGGQPLCFGRLDLEEENAIEGQTTAYIGRLAVSGADQEPLVIDWRAPVAEPFYRATPLDPLGVIRRRHFHMNERKIIRIDDEIFDEESADKNKLNVVGEAALLSAVSRKRTGRMGDIVATIQGEQDMAIRAPLNNVLIVTGGPGTGKTAVALHRAAYLLFTHRQSLSNSGVLLVGPSKTFLRYIDEVLPSLGEDDVYLRTISTLRTSEKVSIIDNRKTAALKGDLRMMSVMKNAMRDREHPLPKPHEVWIDGYRLVLTPRNTAHMISVVSSREGTHNAKRSMFVKMVLRELIKQYEKLLVQAYNGSSRKLDDSSRPSSIAKVVDPEVAKILSEKRHAPEEWVESLEDRLRHNDEVKKAIERMWPVLSGAQLYYDLCSFEALISSASKNILEESEQKVLKKQRVDSIENVQWTDADLPLIDECDSLCGPVSHARGKKKQSSYNSDVENASRVIGELGLSGYMTAAELAQRYNLNETNTGESANDEIRTFGHILIDEAQDLTPMQWRMVARRAQPMSMTIVGDFAQASLPGACKDWNEVTEILNGVSRSNPQSVLLSVNYRTPSEVMDLAHDIMREVSPELAQTDAVRETGMAPYVEKSTNPKDRIKSYIDKAKSVGGTIVVISHEDNHEELSQMLSEYQASAEASMAIDAPVAILKASDAKGLEFDHVVVHDPHQIVGDVRRPSGWKSLFVTCTRATQTLSVLLDEKHDDRLAKIISKYI
ncbi:MAG: AAA family ATPase [Acidimicrobiia bacterium]